MEESGQLETPEKEPWYPMEMRLGRPQNPSGRSPEEKIFPSLLGIELLTV
jgi:hypothetical protein